MRGCSCAAAGGRSSALRREQIILSSGSPVTGGRRGEVSSAQYHVTLLQRYQPLIPTLLFNSPGLAASVVNTTGENSHFLEIEIL